MRNFREKHSTQMAFTKVVNLISEAGIDHKEYVMPIFLDLSKAFDRVNHNILLMILYSYGLRGNIFTGWQII